MAIMSHQVGPTVVRYRGNIDLNIAKGGRTMKKIVVGITVLLLLCGCNMSVIRSKDIEGTPTTYCNVLKEPDPLLMGGWKCGYNRHLSDSQEYDFNPVAYYLVKKGDRYALYFYRATRGGAKRFTGWRDFTINGNEIYSDTGVKFVAKDGEVYYIWRNQKPEKMTRITTE